MTFFAIFSTNAESTDDDKIVSYHWAETSGPVDSHSISEDDLTKQTMVLAGLPPGAYRFKLVFNSLTLSVPGSALYVRI